MKADKTLHKSHISQHVFATSCHKMAANQSFVVHFLWKKILCRQSYVVEINASPAPDVGSQTNHILKIIVLFGVPRHESKSMLLN